MDTNQKIHLELLKRLTKFSETYLSNKQFESYKKSNTNNPKKYSNEKKKNKKIFSTKLKIMKKMKSNGYISPIKYNYQHSLNTYTNLTNNFTEKDEINKNSRYKSQNKKIKINLVSLKFKIADDFNEINSNQFLNEKDECLREEILSDEIKEEVPYFYAKSKKENIHKLSSRKKNRVNNNLNSKKIKKIIIEDDSEASLTKLIEEIK